MHAVEVDLEDEIERFTVRIGKPQAAECLPESRNYKNEAYLIPLLIKDVNQLKLPYKIFSDTIAAYGIPFSSALLYGRVSIAGAGSDCRLRYYLDDGSGIIKLRLLKHKHLNNMKKLGVECYRGFGCNKELYKSIQNILTATRVQLLELGQLQHGTKALVIGRPHKFFEETAFSVFEMIIDKKHIRDLEIAVKNFLIEWYTEKYHMHQLNQTPMTKQRNNQ